MVAATVFFWSRRSRQRVFVYNCAMDIWTVCCNTVLVGVYYNVGSKRIKMNGVLYLFLLVGIAVCSLKDELVAATNTAIPPYPSLIPLYEPLKATLLERAKEGHGDYTLHFKIDRTWRSAPVKLNNAIDEWNESILNTTIVHKRFETAINRLQEHWNNLHPPVLMQRMRHCEYKFVWINAKYQYNPVSGLTMWDLGF